MRHERETKHVNISAIPELLRITQDAIRSRQPVVLTEGDDEIAVITPLQRRGQRRGSDTPTWAAIQALQGIAGSLPTPLSWEEVEQIAVEDRADELQRRGSR